MKRIFAVFLLSDVCFLWGAVGEAKDPPLELGVPFADRAVLQRERPIRIWGKGEPGATVAARLNPSLPVRAKVDGQGRWEVDLPPESACRQGRVLAVEMLTPDGRRQRIECKDVLVGEVWLAAGQSNMECPLWTDDPHRREADGALIAQMTVRPAVRMAKVRRDGGWCDPKNPAYEMGEIRWQRAVPAEMSVDGHWLPSAIGYCFAVGLSDEIGVPVGLVDITVGGTGIDLWLPPDGRLWHNMARPFAPMTVRGMIWYQGCSDVCSPQGYAQKMHRLHAGWSEAFRLGKIPFFFAQVAVCQGSHMVEIQEEQERFAREEPAAGMVTTCDHGNFWDCHPTDKAVVARRLLAYALAREYGYDWLRPEPPMLKSWKVEGERVVLSFDHVRSWYQYHPDFSVNSGFEIAGSDGIWKEAELVNLVVREKERYKSRGKINGRDLVVRAPGVGKPVTLRYLHKEPGYGSLKNEMSLPLGPFHVSCDTPSSENAADVAAPCPNAATMKRLADDDTVIGIVHFTVNTFTDREWGYGSEDPKVFDPTDFSAEQIVKACADGGIKGLVVVAKHHDGFCLWPTKTTEHNISKSPFRCGKGDYVREMSEACRKFGVKFGVYCSPWDRNNAEYGRPKYVETYHEQIRELTGGAYGPIFELWLDGANGGDGYYGGAWEKRSIKDGYYRFGEVTKFVRGHNPELTIFGFGGEFVWPGNERGVVDPNSGCTRGKRFAPYEADFPLRPGWFYHQSQDGFSRSGEFLMKVWLRTVGNAATMNIGISPDRRGRLTDEDAAALRRFAELKKSFFANEVTSADPPFNLVVMEEDVREGERVDAWRLMLDGREIAQGGKIGFRRIRTFERPVSGAEPKLEITAGRIKSDEVKVRRYYVDPSLLGKVLSSSEPKQPPAPFELRGVLSVKRPDSLTFTVKHPQTIRALMITPDKDRLGGTPVVFRLATSLDGEKWTEDKTEYRLDNVEANPIAQRVDLSQKAQVKYVRLTAVRTLSEGAAAALAGLELVP